MNEKAFALYERLRWTHWLPRSVNFRSLAMSGLSEQKPAKPSVATWTDLPYNIKLAVISSALRYAADIWHC